MPNASIILPTYSEKGNIAALVEEIRSVDKSINIIIVDDNSPDGTGKLADGMAAKYPEVSVIHRTGKFGLGTAYVAGFKHALKNGADYIFEMDSDFQHPPRLIPDFLEAIKRYDLVLGSRYCRAGKVVDWNWRKLMVSRFGTFYTRMITGLPVSDATSGYKCFRREVLEQIDLDNIYSNGYSFQIEMTYKAYYKGFRIGEVPIVFEPRLSGVSKMNFKIALEAMFVVWILKIEYWRERLNNKSKSAHRKKG